MYTNPYVNPYLPVASPVIPQIIPKMEIQKAHGEEGAKAYAIGPDSSVILLDTVDPIVWIVVTDSVGSKTITPFDVVPHIEKKPITTDDLKLELENISNRLNKLEERMTENEQSDHVATRTGKRSTTDTKPNDGNGQGGHKPAGGNNAAGSD